MRAYGYLALAIALEVVGTAALKASDGFTNAAAGAVVLVGYLGAFYLLGLALQDLPVGLVYAVWSGVGIVGAAAVGVVFFEEQVDLAGLLGLALVVAGIVVLTQVSTSYSPAH